MPSNAQISKGQFRNNNSFTWCNFYFDSLYRLCLFWVWVGIFQYFCVILLLFLFLFICSATKHDLLLQVFWGSPASCAKSRALLGKVTREHCGSFEYHFFIFCLCVAISVSVSISIRGQCRLNYCQMLGGILLVAILWAIQRLLIEYLNGTGLPLWLG